MKRSIFLVLPVFLLAIFLLSKTALAEIATTTDWIGLFLIGAGHKKSDTANGNTWVYTSSCTQSPDPAPQLSRNVSPDPSPCTFNVSPSPAPGDYEYRMYANDYDVASNDDSGLLAISSRVRSGPATASSQCPVQNLYPRAEGLISALNISNNFGNRYGQCVISAQAPFAPYEIPTYASLKSLYYTQSKAYTEEKSSAALTPITLGDDGHVINYTNTDVRINPSAFTYKGTAVVFFDGNLTIKGDVKTDPNDPTKGLVLIVKGDVNIDPGVTQIDAVIIAAGNIYTAGSGCSHNSTVTTANQLVVNGSLISIYQNQAQEQACTSGSSSLGCPVVEFCRTLGLANSSTPAELINQQSKYPVILRDLYAETQQTWSEIQ